mmetsp:Transcript_16944/g.29951  ORF Transcript_16944/g.29951 Transcript_16944/m.29951 type:complete len:294 (+) Transcript_16944:208-1089(+)
MSVSKILSRALSSSSSAGLPLRMSGQVCIVTGAAGGIGRESAVLFAKNGAAGLIVTDVNEEGCQETLRLIEDVVGKGKVISHCVDVSKQEHCKEMVDIAEQQFGKVTVLFNNAGIMHGSDDDAEATEESVWDLTMNINVKGVFLGCKYAIPAMRRAGGGSIINTASFVGSLGAATPQLAYTTSKGAVLSLTRELAAVHARENIRVNSLSPGPLNTPLLQKFLDSDEKKKRRLVHVPMGRFGEASEMANAALFLASTESSFVTGADLKCDGGITSAYVTPEGDIDPFGGPTVFL